MPTITLTTWGHAGVRIDHGGNRLVIDPGTFTDPAILEGAEAVLVTHEHADHFDSDQVSVALAADPQLRLFGPESVVSQLRAAGGDRCIAVDGGDRFSAAGLEVVAVGHDHAPVHADIPVVANVAYLIEGSVFHPGDSFTLPPTGASVEVLALPISAPWLKVAEAADHLRQVRPRIAVPIHDGVLNDAGRALHDRIVGGLADGAEYRRLAPREELTL